MKLLYENVVKKNGVKMEENELKEWYENSETWIEIGDICYKQDLCMYSLYSYINGIKYQQEEGEEKNVEVMKRISILYGRLCRFDHALSSIQNVLLINPGDVECVKIKENLVKALEEQRKKE